MHAPLAVVEKVTEARRPRRKQDHTTGRCHALGAPHCVIESGRSFEQFDVHVCRLLGRDGRLDQWNQPLPALGHAEHPGRCGAGRARSCQRPVVEAAIESAHDDRDRPITVRLESGNRRLGSGGQRVVDDESAVCGTHDLKTMGERRKGIECSLQIIRAHGDVMTHPPQRCQRAGHVRSVVRPNQTTRTQTHEEPTIFVHDVVPPGADRSVHAERVE